MVLKNKMIIIKIILIVLVLIGIGVAYWLIVPFFVTKQVNEKLEDIMQINKSSPPASQPETSGTLPSPKIIAEGTFVGLDGHDAEGQARLIKVADKYYIRFENDFKVTNGPDLFVQFGKNGQSDASAVIARLKGNVGGQNYEVPAGLNPADYNEVWVWCRAFSVPFGKATFK